MSERVSIVNEHDEIIGEKNREDLLESDCWREVSIWIVNDKQEVLLAQRSKLKKLNPGIWAASTAGTVVAGDSYDETSKREIAEELGVSDIQLKPISKYYFKDLTHGYRQKWLYFGKCDLAIDSFTIQKEEVEQIKWVPIDVALNMLIESAGENPYAKEYWSKVFDTDKLKAFAGR